MYIEVWYEDEVERSDGPTRELYTYYVDLVDGYVWLEECWYDRDWL